MRQAGKTKSDTIKELKERLASIEEVKPECR